MDVHAVSCNLTVNGYIGLADPDPGRASIAAALILSLFLGIILGETLSEQDLAEQGPEYRPGLKYPAVICYCL